jgi:XTP/dITP diphosphohydrolase
MTIWFATGNTHKKEELSTILNTAGNVEKRRILPRRTRRKMKNQIELRVPPWLNILTPADVGLDFDPEETETTFSGNAMLKARALYEMLNTRRPSPYSPGDPVIADDSGLCVDALGGRPGIFSARYAGANSEATNGSKKLQACERNALLLAEMGDEPQRSARFICAMALFYSEDRFFIAQEVFEGEIVKSPELIKGTGGFGYDPIFFLPDRGCTAAELSDDEKNMLSHRAKAGKIIAAIVKAQSWCQNSI